LEAQTANPGSLHQEGQAARAELDRVRRLLSAELGVSTGRIVFTSGATEANNLALQTMLSVGSVAAAATEHASVAEVLALAQAGGASVTILAVDGAGLIALDEVERLLRNGLRSIALLAYNNETGVRQPVEEVAALCLAHGAHLHVDAAQHLFRYPWMHRAGISSVTISSHKAGGPTGVGALWWGPERGPAPLMSGGAQERGARPGTEAGWLVGSLGQLAGGRDFADWAALGLVRDAFEERLAAELGAVPNGALVGRAPNTSNLWLPGHEAEQGLMALDLAGIAASAGSACHAGALEPSPVLLAMGLGEERVASSLRFSFGPEHSGLSGAEIADRVLTALRGS
jgi:cysteine desulfurase